MQMSRWWVRSGVDSVSLLLVARPEALVVVLSWCVSGSGDEDYGDSDADGDDGGADGADGGGGRWWKRLCYGNKNDCVSCDTVGDNDDGDDVGESILIMFVVCWPPSKHTLHTNFSVVMVTKW